MANLSIKVSDFEGPLDLLMHLIERDKIDIYDIPIVSITEQYISYLKDMSEFDMEVASEFLVMAATLLQIKSRMLLPKEVAASEEEEADPRQMLVEMLVEYRKIKRRAAALLELKAVAGQVFARKPYFADSVQLHLPNYHVRDLLLALAGIVNDENKPTAYIEPQAFSVQEKITEIMERLRGATTGFRLSDLFSVGSRGEKVAAFLGVLELLKMGAITIAQSEQFAPIYIFAKQGEQEDVL
ncbi:MAG: segregation/condensation protein A [Phascolarctobacterium sp.]|nr:segregation/condensation protein A [Phascolarctobacterium sp.]